jgi:hypothetical protein
LRDKQKSSAANHSRFFMAALNNAICRPRRAIEPLRQSPSGATAVPRKLRDKQKSSAANHSRFFMAALNNAICRR